MFHAITRRALLLVTCTLLLQHIVSAQIVSNTGKDFWVGYGHHQFMEPGMGNGQTMVLYISAGQTANVTVSIEGTTWVRNYTIPANTSITTEPIPKAGVYDARLYSQPPSFGGTGSEGLFANKGIHIVSNVPVVANAHIYGSASSGSTMLMPSESWGYSYTSLNSQQYYQGNCFSWMYVVAKENNTLVEITPSVQTRNGRAPGVPFTVTMNRGQIYQILGTNLGAGYGSELTGTKVRSIPNSNGDCFPIGAFSGSSRTYITCPSGNPGGGDNIIQQLLPEHTWGRRYLTAPFSNSNGVANPQTCMYRVMVKDASTVVKRNGTVLGPLLNNTYYEFASNTADLIESDKPVMVAQFMASVGGCNNVTGDADPEMIYLSPLGQGVKKTGFRRSNLENINVNYVTLIVPTAALPSLLIDGGNSYDHVYEHPQLTGYTVVVKRYAASDAYGSITCDQPFTGITYGLGTVESYGYNVGMQLKSLSGIGQIKNRDGSAASSEFTCEGTPVKLSVLLPYQPSTLTWKISSAGAGITPAADVVQHSPVHAATQTVDGVSYYQYTLPGNYTFTGEGEHNIPVEVVNPFASTCDQKETIYIRVEVRQPPDASVTVIHPTACTLDTVYFSASATDAAFTFDKWTWTFGDGSTITTRDAKKVFSPGTHQVKLQAVSTEGCISPDSASFLVRDRPASGFTSSAPKLCENGSIAFTDTSSAYTGVTHAALRYWDFGNGVQDSDTVNTSRTVTYNTYGTYKIKLVNKISTLCISDTAIMDMTVYANPSTVLTVPDDCLPADRTATFTSNPATADGQTISGYQWDFGDGSGTATVKDPSYQYARDSTYPVHFTVTTDNGCSNDTTVDVTISGKPELNYSVVPPVCESATGPASVATAAVLNGVVGAGIYSGPGIDAAGVLLPGTAGAGSHTAKYVFTTAQGCKDSISTTFTVRAKPDIVLGLPSGCLAATGAASFTSNPSTVDGQTISSYQWDFGDGTGTSAAKDPVYQYAKDGTYPVHYTATTNNGCTNDTTVDVAITMKPALNYSAVTPVCESATGPASVANATVLNGATGTGVYSGPGIDGAGNLLPGTTGAGSHTAKYVFTTTNGCKDSVSTTFTVRAKPDIVLGLPSGCLPVNGEARFTSTPTTADGQTISSYQWNFGDGTAVSTAKDPVHQYARPGDYTVTYTATTANGCTNDSSVQVELGMLPKLAYGVIPPVCASQPGPVTVATAIVENNLQGSGIYSGTGISAAGTFNPAVAGVGTHAVKYIFTTSDGCVDSVSSSITVNPLPVASFVASTDSVCQGGSVTFTDMSTGGVSAWNWDFGDGGTASTANPSRRFNTPGDFDVRLRVTDAAGCVSEPFSVPVVAMVLPVIDAGPSFTVKEGTLIQFQPTVNDSTNVSFRWSPFDDFTNATPEMLRPMVLVSREAIYTLTATSGRNCTATDQLTVTLIKAVKPPNAFSPNGDNINDTWVIRELVHYPDCIVEVFNRYGQRLYRSNGYGTPWDGKYRGSPLPIGTYYYVIQPGAGEKPVSGSVTILK
jgi:gliding motility-associated-like protein